MSVCGQIEHLCSILVGAATTQPAYYETGLTSGHASLSVLSVGQRA
jgi:hypothetical protein